MVIYIEYVIFDNFFLDLFIGLIVCECLMLSKIRAVISASLGTLLALIYPLVETDLLTLFKILSLLTCCIPFVRKDLYSYVKASLIFLFISFIYRGLISLLFGFTEPIIENKDGMKVGILSLGCILSFIVIKGVLKVVGKKVNSGRLLKSTVYLKNEVIRAVGFMDSGNIARASDGNGVVFLDRKLSERLDDKIVDYIMINTVNGQKIFEIIKLDKVEIYFGGQKHIYKNVNAAKTTQKYNGFEILLSTKLKEYGI